MADSRSRRSHHVRLGVDGFRITRPVCHPRCSAGGARVLMAPGRRSLRSCVRETSAALGPGFRHRRPDFLQRAATKD